jgi:hypothetical protein
MNITIGDRILACVITIIVLYIFSLWLNGCMRENKPISPLAGNTYSHVSDKDSSLVLVAKFTKDSLFYFAYEDGQNGFCATAYTIEKLGDKSNYRITVETIPEWWDSNEWDVWAGQGGIKSLRTGRWYEKEENGKQ